ncbi:unnamed protein product, partial [Rotaria sp. Silwood1]
MIIHSHHNNEHVWLTGDKRKKLKKEAGVKQRIELIQGFEMTMLSSCISMTRDGQY